MMKRRDFVTLSGSGLILAGISPLNLVGLSSKENLRWEKSADSKLFHQLLCNGKPGVKSDQLGLLNAECTLIEGEKKATTIRITPESEEAEMNGLKIRMRHSLINSQLGEGEDLLKAQLTIQNSSKESISLDTGFITGAQPADWVENQKIYIPVSATGLNKDKRLAELGSQDFHQECELQIGKKDFACHYLEPMASSPSEQKTKALILAPVLEIMNEASPWRMALFTPSDQPFKYSTLKDNSGNPGWMASRRIEIAPGGKADLECYLLCHKGEADKAWEVFHQQAHFDEFASPDWLNEVKVHYYDFLSSADGKDGLRGLGYEADIPHFTDFQVGLATQHGYYPYIGDFFHPERKTWTAMKNDPAGAAKMSVSKMKDRIKATRAAGANAGVYMHTVCFDDASPLFSGMKDSVLVDQDGQKKKYFWKGPDTVSQNWWMSFASADWRKNLLRQAEYIMDTLDPDAIVFDETFVCLGYENHPDRSGPLSPHSIEFFREMRRLVHSFGENKALLTSDCGGSNMVMWADGDAGDHSYSSLLGNPLYRKEPIRYKAAIGEKPWVPCSWHFLNMWEEQMDLARKMGTAVGVSNGWIEFNGLKGLDPETSERLRNDIKEIL